MKGRWLCVAIRKNLLLVWSVAGALLACQDRPEPPLVAYRGPVSETYGVTLITSDSGHKVIRLQTPLQLDMESGDRVFPKEVKLYFYDKNGLEHTWLRADSGRYVQQQNIYRVMGKVQIERRLTQEHLRTDLLNWNPETKKIYNDRPVTVQTPTQFIQGHSLQANQDFLKYSLKGIRRSRIQVQNLPE